MPGVGGLLNTGLAVAGGALSIAGGVLRTSLKIAADVASAVLPGGEEPPPQAARADTAAESPDARAEAEAPAQRSRSAKRSTARRSGAAPARSTRRTRKAPGATARARAANEVRETDSGDGPHSAADAAPSPAEMREAGRDVAEDDVELAATTADPGAEEGAGANVTIEAPWEDYDALTAEEVERRIEESPPLVAAAVRIYEREHGGRPGVIRAAERRIDSDANVG